MSAPVDVLAVTNFVEALRLEIEIADTYAPSYEAVELRIVTMRRDVAAGLLESLEELIEAVETYAASEAALSNRELAGVNAEPHEKLQRRVHSAREELDAALARVRGVA